MGKTQDNTSKASAKSNYDTAMPSITSMLNADTGPSSTATSPALNVFTSLTTPTFAKPSPHKCENPKASTSRFATASADERDAEQQRRYLEHNFAIQEHEERTKMSRMWYSHHMSQKKARDYERIKLAARIPALEQELARARASLVKLDAAQKLLETKHAEQSAQGKKDAEKLELWKGYGRLHHDTDLTKSPTEKSGDGDPSI